MRQFPFAGVSSCPRTVPSNQVTPTPAVVTITILRTQLQAAVTVTITTMRTPFLQPAPPGRASH